MLVRTSVLTLLTLVVVLAGAPTLVASPSSHPNLGTYRGEASVHVDESNWAVDSCSVAARLWGDSAWLRFQSCWNVEPFSHCSFPLEYVGRVGLGAWRWRISGPGRNASGRTCRAPRSIPVQRLTMYGSSYAARHSFTVRARGSKVLETTLERL